MRVFTRLAALAASIVLSLPAAAEPKSAPGEMPVRDAVTAGATLTAGAGATAAAIGAGLARPLGTAGNSEPSSAAPIDRPVLEAAKPKPPALVARIDLSSQRIEVSVHGQPAHTWAISSGRSGYATPRGTFRVQWTSRMWYSRKYDNAPMPHAVFFNGGVAVHATQAIGMLGRPASHGCIRLAPGNAAQFYALVQKHGNANTQIQVFGGAPSERVAERRERGSERQLRRVSERTSVGERTSVSQRASGGQRTIGAARDYAGDQSGRLYLRPSHASYGQASFMQNGVRYVRIR